MKKQIILLAGTAIIFASCGGNNNNQGATDQARIDSVTKANAALQDQVNKQKNDSTINAMAKAKADSMEMAKNANAKHEPSHKHTTKEAAPVPEPTPPPAPVKTAQDNKFESRKTGSQATKPTLTPDQQKAQDDKFKNRGR